MNRNIISWLAASLVMLPALFSFNTQAMDTNTSTPQSSMTRVEIVTTEGNVIVGLYNDTPKHRDNFIKLVKEGFYDGLLFHRVIRDFMVQTGDPESRNAPAGKRLGAGNAGYEIDAEILCPTHINKRGALAAARTGDNVNPLRRSSGSQFYIVTGNTFNDQQLSQMEQRANQDRAQDIFNRLSAENADSIKALRLKRDSAGLEALRQSLVDRTLKEVEANPFKYTDEQREIYRTQGGAPHLDGAYTVFGEVLSGLDVVEKIERVATDGADRPVNDVKIISMKVLD